MAGFHKLPRLLVLRASVQNYDWGGTDFIPSLLGVTNEKKQPFAELWIGAHPKSPSVAKIDGEEIPLDKLFESHATELMGKQAVRKFDNCLPFLFKVLDVNKMLSIQVHPTKAQAEAGFARENGLAIPLSAPNRNYKDGNHKPEVHVALTDFWMLHGFRPPAEIARMLTEIPEFKNVMPDFTARLQQAGENAASQENLLKSLYIRVMTMPQTEVDECLSPLIARLSPLYEAKALEKNTPDFWAARAASQFSPREGKYNRGIFSIYLLNLIHLKPGQGTFQDAGILHAYLEGRTVELMANSDNVLRGGLTPKHVDIPELLQIVKFTGAKPAILFGEFISDNEAVFKTPAHDFQLSKMMLSPGVVYKSQALHGLDIFLLLQGKITAVVDGKSDSFTRGSVFLLRANTNYSLQAEEEALLFRATAPV